MDETCHAAVSKCYRKKVRKLARSFGTWQDAARTFFSELASTEAASRGFTGVKHAAVWKCYI